jgi:hypothetical protein
LCDAVVAAAAAAAAAGPTTTSPPSPPPKQPAFHLAVSRLASATLLRSRSSAWADEAAAWAGRAGGAALAAASPGPPILRCASIALADGFVGEAAPEHDGGVADAGDAADDTARRQALEAAALAGLAPWLEGKGYEG